jgi:starch synthase
MVLIEAMSSGTPVVATRLPGFAEVMEDGVHGLMVESPDDAAGFAAALDSLLENPERARALGEAGRKRAVDTFAFPEVGDALEELYMRLLARRSGVFRSTSTVATHG